MNPATLTDPAASQEADTRNTLLSHALRRFAWFVLAYNILVVLWGGVVRATGSGGGCGDHWPLCNGVVLPQLARLQTFVEFAHRMTSGATLLLVVGLLIWTWRATQPGQLSRWATCAATVLVVNEALLGAGLVLFGLVGQSQSVWRSVYLGCHLTNTLLLLASLALSAEFLSRPRSRATTGLRRGKLVFPVLGILATLIVGVSGSLAALGDTLFPSSSLAGAFKQDFSGHASLLLRLRWIHPASAIVAGAFIAWLLVQAFRTHALRRTRALGIAVLCTLLAQYLLGIADVLLLAPTWLQILHLLGADVFWICFVLLAADYCLMDRPSEPAAKQVDESFARA